MKTSKKSKKKAPKKGTAAYELARLVKDPNPKPKAEVVADVGDTESGGADGGEGADGSTSQAAGAHRL